MFAWLRACSIACSLICLLHCFLVLYACLVFGPTQWLQPLHRTTQTNKRHCKCEISGLVLVCFLARLFACLFICVFVVGFFRLLVCFGPRDGCSHCIGPNKNKRYCKWQISKVCVALSVCLVVSFLEIVSVWVLRCLFFLQQPWFVWCVCNIWMRNLS